MVVDDFVTIRPMKEGLPREAAIIFNPKAGVRKHTEGQIESAAKEFQDRGWCVEIFSTLEPGHATELAKNAWEKDIDVVIAAGGDGTLNESMQALVDTSTALGCLPTGTVNVWARELNIPRNIKKAANQLADGQVKRVDVGSINGRNFLLFAGAGFDGHVSMKMHKPGEARIRKGRRAYAGIIAENIWDYPSHKAKITTAGEEVEIDLLQIIFHNTRRYADFLLRPEARCDDGRLQIGMYQGQYARELLFQLIDTQINNGRAPKNARYTSSTDITVETNKPIPYQADGEPVGTSDMLTVSIKPASLNVLVPAKSNSMLFSK